MKDKVKGIAEKANNIIDLVSPIVGFLFPKATTGLVLADEIIERLSQIDEKVSDEVIFGLSEVSLYLDEMIINYKSNKTIDIDKLKTISSSIKVLDKSLDNFYNLIS